MFDPNNASFQASLYRFVPEEMRHYRQWIVWRYEDRSAPKPTKVPYSARTGRPASVNDPATWCDFDTAVRAALSGEYSGLGFVLTEGDPFTFIDLDDTEGDGALFARHQEIFNTIDSYAERSPSGTGLHIICKATTPHGRKRDKIELYSSQRFMTMTGDVFRNAPINFAQEQVTGLYETLTKSNLNVSAHYLGLGEEKETDEQIYNRAIEAANGGKFSDLWSGNWENYYSSQSEADFALVDILAFYSQNRGQIQRMFRMSGLGQRAKAMRDDYVSYMLNKCFDRMLPPVDIADLQHRIRDAIEASQRAEASHGPAIVADEHAIDAQPMDLYKLPDSFGLVKEIANFIYAQAPRQIPEIALAGALALMAGIVGRSFNVAKTGLNQYFLLLAPTGVGKEAMARGIDKLLKEVKIKVPTANEFIGPGQISSEPALNKYMANGPKSFVSIVGEFGLFMQQLGAQNAPSHLVGLRKLILDLYNKSGQDNMIRPSVYSDREKNIPEFSAPGFSILGESTPETFFEGMHEGLLSSGLLPRFTLIEYKGKKPLLNKNHASVVPSPQLIEKLATLCAMSQGLNSQNVTQNVAFTPDAQVMFDKYDVFCTGNENNAQKDMQRQVWSRCHVKAMKLAGLIAIGVNPYSPTITVELGEWAINIANRDALNLLGRFEAGEVGTDSEEGRQLSLATTAIRDYLMRPWSEISTYSGAGFSQLHGEQIIPYSYLHRKLFSQGPFKKDKRGATNAVKNIIKTLIERGDVKEMSKAVTQEKYKTSAACYIVERPGSFGL